MGQAGVLSLLIMPFKFGFSIRPADQPDGRDMHLHAVRRTQVEGEEPRDLQWSRRIRRRDGAGAWSEIKHDRVLRFLIKLLLISGSVLVGMLLVLSLLSR